MSRAVWKCLLFRKIILIPDFGCNGRFMRKDNWDKIINFPSLVFFSV